MDQKKGTFAYLNVTQFLGVLNDNLFKLLLIFMLIQVQGVANSELILSLAGAIFVIPFLLFSIPAGTLADRISKRKIVVFTKLIELISASLGIIAFAYKSAFGLYFVLFLLATQSAIFGPSKYGIVPELVPPEKLSKSNGYLSSFTFLAIILGTSLAGPLVELTNRDFFIPSLVCLVIAIIGLITSLQIAKTPAAGSTKNIKVFFLADIYRTLKHSLKTKHLLIAILGSAYFLFVGGFTQLNVIPYAINCLQLTDVQGSYLFLITAFGIGLGSLVAGKLSGTRVELGLSPFGAFGIAVSCLFLGLCSDNLYYVEIALFFLGFFGGIYLIPLDSFIQFASPNDERGQNVATNNFMAFFGVLIASALLFFISHILHLPAEYGFLLMGVFTLIVAVTITVLLRNRIRTLFSASPKEETEKL